ncbi:hypothetical protein B9G55_04305 [Saccharibacillus sp. O16]|nr:hypothetical protein B9G55_04305 [Saccharibacillus sp. O16]
MQEKLKTLHSISKRLEQAGVDYVVGGSGTLFGLGLVESVRDWDLMTDASEAEIRQALHGLALTAEQGVSELYGSKHKLKIEGLEPEVEVIIGFAIRSAQGLCQLPAYTGGVRRGLRIASPEVWFAAYALMGRTEKAAQLEAYLQKHGADADVLASLSKEPLPEELAQRLVNLPHRAASEKPF